MNCCFLFSWSQLNADFYEVSVEIWATHGHAQAGVTIMTRGHRGGTPACSAAGEFSKDPEANTFPLPNPPNFIRYPLVN